MKLQVNIATVVCAAFSALTIYSVVGHTGNYNSKKAFNIFKLPGDSTHKKDSVKLKYPMQDQQGDFVTNPDNNPMGLHQPANITDSVVYDPTTNQYEIMQKYGDEFYRNPSYMSFDDFLKYEYGQDESSYFQEKRDASSVLDQSSVVPKINVDSKLLDRLFGSSTINIKPQGSVDLTFGDNFQNIENPILTLQQRKQSSFIFNMNINMNVVGTIGDKLKLGVSYNTQSQFDFENQEKLGYSGDQDQIIKKVEAGNVTLPLTSQLIQGSQSLFGVKATMQFGRLTVTGIVAKENAQQQSITVQNGTQTQNFSLKSDQYDQYRNYFLGQFFKDNYDKWNASPGHPIIDNGINITRIEVWETNITGAVTNTRNIDAFMDMGEAHPYDSAFGLLTPNKAGTYPSFAPTTKPPVPVSNDLNTILYGGAANQLRTLATTTSELTNTLGFQQIRDFEQTYARLLSPTEYTLQPQLGYIMLNQQLNPSEVLAVAYQYTYRGKVYQVGEFAEDVAPNPTNPNVLFLKLLQNSSQTPKLPIWQLQMKNIYSLGAYQISQTNFLCDLFYLDPSGTQRQFVPVDPIKSTPLVRVEGLDVLNSNNEPVPDGVFDFIPNVTINPALGKIIFPVVEPFGSHLAKVIGNSTNAASFLYQQLYDSTITVALEFPQYDRYLIQGSYQSSTSSVISLGAFNIPQGSVKVTAGGQQLVENQDYTIDYNLGQLRIINQNILASGLPINVSFENNSLTGFDTKTLFGTRMDYYVNDNLKLGLTYLHLSERPYTTLLNVGEDPISNGILGLDANYHSQADWISKTLNLLPFFSTKANSSVTLTGEVARLFPGHSATIGSAGQVYIDDFEGAQSTYPLNTPISNWALCSVPYQSPINSNTSKGPYYFDEAAHNNNLDYGFHRAKLAWYSIDPVFYSNASTNPTYIQQDTTDTSGLSNLYTRQVFNQEVYPTAQNIPGVPNYLPTFDLSYFPNERGPYNYDANKGDFNSDGSGTFIKTVAAQNFGGIMTALSYTDFNAANIEYLDFWVLYPFYSYPNYNSKNSPNPGGELIVNLGDISEDILKDGHQFFENGLPTPSSLRPTQTSVWGVQPLIPPITNAFDNDPTTRAYEDVGFDGMGDAQEQTYFSPYLNKIQGVVSSAAYSQIYADPSGDDYHYYLGTDYDNEHLSILNRYQSYNGTEGNSPIATAGQTIVSAETNVPDAEDINHDFTMESDENYYQYKVDITPNDTFPGHDYVYDKVDTTIKLPDGKAKTETWIEYRVPIESFTNVVGNISGFTSIRFMRMFLTGFTQHTIMRFGVLQFVRNSWRPYQFSLETPGENLGNATSSNTTFNIGSVSIEQNSTRKPVNYVMPPGVQQQVTQAFTGANVLQDEQSLSLQIGNLTDGDARAAYKIVQVDMREYQRLQMFSHCEAANNDNLQNGDLMAFIRIGSDFTENYYEYALPLVVTQPGFYSNGSPTVWPTQNNFNILLDSLVGIKVARDGAKASLTVPYVWNLPNGGTITIVGNPNLGQATTIMLGVRNPKKGTRPGIADNGAPHSTEVWFDEMRLAGFIEKGGDAAIARSDIKLADLGSLTVAGNMHTIGFGQLSSSLDQRDMDNFYQFNAAAQLQLGKLLPKSLGLSIPAYFGISESISLPEYDPYELDVPLSETLSETTNTHTRDSLRQAAETFTSIKSINFTNIRRQNPNTKAKVHFFSLSNFNLTYAYTRTYNHNPTELSDITTLQHLELGYNYAPKFKGFYPFSFISSKDKYLKFIKDFGFNPIPTSLSFRTAFDRMFESTILRPTFSGELPDTTFNEYFKNLRAYGVKWDFTKSLNVNFNATATSFIDEPYGYIDDKTKQDSLWTNIKNLGRLMTYNHTFDAAYTLPFSKFPILDWISASAHYSASYGWQAAPLVLNTVYGPDSIVEKTYLAPSTLGNIINNTQNIQLTGDLNFKSLYNKSKFLKRFDTSTQPTQKNNKNSKTPPNQQNDKTKKEKQEPPPNQAEAFFVRLLLSLKRISASYTETNSTTLPGFTQTPTFIGNNFKTNSPGIPFIFGYQPNAPWLLDAAAKGWITNDTNLNYQFIQNAGRQFNARVSFEPFKDFNLDLTWMRNYQISTSEYFKDTLSNGRSQFAFLNPLESGSFTISFFALRTLFEGVNQYGIPNSFSRFESYRTAISQRLGIQDPFSGLNPSDSAYYSGYGRYQQDVLLPAFLAAYAGKNPFQVNINPFFSIPLPNWKITYNGLTKIQFFQKLFSSFSLTNAYTCTYSIGSFSNSLNFSGININGTTVPTYIDPTTGNFVSFYQIPMVMVTEQLAPLLGLDMTWKNSLITKFEYDFSRTLGFSFLNNQLAETKTEQITIGFGYRWKRFPIPFKIHGLRKRLNNDLEFRCDISYTNNTVITYQLDQNFSQPTSGGENILISPTINYVVNKQLNVQLFFNKNISIPETSASYPIIYTKVGITLKFTLQ